LGALIYKEEIARYRLLCDQFRVIDRLPKREEGMMIQPKITDRVTRVDVLKVEACEKERERAII